jgi:hypothetical protein
MLRLDWITAFYGIDERMVARASERDLHWASTDGYL